MGCHSLQIEQGRLVTPHVALHLQRCTFRNRSAPGDERTIFLSAHSLLASRLHMQSYIRRHVVPWNIWRGARTRKQLVICYWPKLQRAGRQHKFVLISLSFLHGRSEPYSYTRRNRNEVIAVWSLRRMGSLIVECEREREREREGDSTICPFGQCGL